MTYGTLIKQSREARRLTQEQLAEHLDVTRQAVSKWEADLSRPTREKLDKLSELLDIPPETWAQIDAENAPPEPEPDPRVLRPWKIAVAVLAVVCLGLAIALTAALWPRNLVPSEDAVADDPANVPVNPYENEPIPDPDETSDTEAIYPDPIPLTTRRDFDFGDWPLATYDPAEIPFLEDDGKVMEEELWCDWFPDGTRLSLVPVTAAWDETGGHTNVYLLYAPPVETTGGELEYHILYRIMEDFTGDDRGDPEGEAFADVLGYDGFKVTISAAENRYRHCHYVAQRDDGTPCVITVTETSSYAYDADEDGQLEIVSHVQYTPGWEVIDTVEGEEGAFIYKLDYSKIEPERDRYLLGFDERRGGFIVLDGVANSVITRYVLRDGELVGVPPTDFTAADYPDVVDTEITFVTDYEQSQSLSDELDPDVILPYNPKVNITHRQQAYIALQELYNMTGIKLDSCYCTASEFGVDFSMLPDGFNQRGFFSANLGEDYGAYGIPSFHISWQELGNDWSPLAFAEAVQPEGETFDEQMRWYYERMDAFNTGEIDYLSCLPLEPGAGEIAYTGDGSFFLKDGSLYNAGYQERNGRMVLITLFGPYPDGVANH